MTNQPEMKRISDDITYKILYDEELKEKEQFTVDWYKNESCSGKDAREIAQAQLSACEQVVSQLLQEKDATTAGLKGRIEGLEKALKEKDNEIAKWREQAKETLHHSAENQALRSLKMKSNEREKIYLQALSDIASNLGSGSLLGSELDRGARPLRIHASQALLAAGFQYQENPDGWVNEKDKIFFPDSSEELCTARGYSPLHYIGWTIFKKVN